MLSNVPFLPFFLCDQKVAVTIWAGSYAPKSCHYKKDLEKDYMIQKVDQDYFMRETTSNNSA